MTKGKILTIEPYCKYVDTEKTKVKLCIDIFTGKQTLESFYQYEDGKCSYFKSQWIKGKEHITDKEITKDEMIKRLEKMYVNTDCHSRCNIDDYLSMLT